MEIRQLQVVLAVAAAGSFSAAADELYLSQSSLSKQVIALEKELGVALFDRSKRQIVVTPAGAAFLAHARTIVAAHQALLADLARFQARSILRIVAIPVIAHYGITAFVAQFRRSHPDVELALEEREAMAILPALADGQFDLAFVRDNYLETTDYLVQPIAADRFCVVLGRQHPLATRSALALAELAGEEFVMFGVGTGVHELAVDACRAAGFEPAIVYTSLRVDTVLGLVASNAGIGLVMEQVVAYQAHPDVVVVPLKEQICSNIVLAAPKSAALTRPARLFWAHVARAAIGATPQTGLS